MLTSRNSFNLTAGHIYRLSIVLAGNQFVDNAGAGVEVKVFTTTSTILDHIISPASYTSPFSTTNLSFTAAADATVWISLEEQDSGTDVDARWGCLLNGVTFTDTTTLETLLSDNFDTENLTFVPPRCGASSLYPSVYGTACYGYGCLDEPPGVQSEDPSPLADVEVGTPSPTAPCTRTTTATASCGANSINLSTSPLVPASVSDSGPNNIQAVLTGLLWSIPINPSDNSAPDPADQSKQITGEAGTTYTVGLRIRGVVEYKNFHCFGTNCYKYNGDPLPAGDVTLIAGTNDMCLLYNQPLPDVGGKVGTIIPTDDKNEYTLTISSPLQVYVLNNIPHNRPASKLFTNLETPDYDLTVQIDAGATVTLAARTINGQEANNAYLVEAVDDDPTHPIGLAQPYPGQFMQMDVMSVAGGAIAGTLPVHRVFTFATAQTVSDYTVSRAATAANWPTYWTLEGSNDGSTWTALDSRDFRAIGAAWYAFSQGESRRYLVTTPGAFTQYRLSIIATNDAAAPGLGQCSLYAAAPATVTSDEHSETRSGTNACSDALAAATLDAQQDAQGRLNCVHYYDATASHTSTCPTGSINLGAASVQGQGTARSLVSQADADYEALSEAIAAADAQLDCSGSNNENYITIADMAPAEPYPSVQYFSGKTGHVTSAIVKLHGLTHQCPSDLVIVVQAPSKETCVLMAKNGYWGGGTGFYPVTGLELVFDDTATDPLPVTGQISSGTFKPSQNGDGLWGKLVNSGGAPQGVGLSAPYDYGTALSVFHGVVPNGSWDLWIIDELGEHVGFIANGWEIILTTA